LVISRSILLLVATLFCLPAMVRGETPTQAVDRVWNVYVSSSVGKTDNEIFAKDFLLLSRDVAKEQGIAVLAPIMVRAKAWKDEECLIFVPLVCFLPRDQATLLLHRYRRQGKPWEQQAATDFLTEFEMSDTKAMIEAVPKK
jgi:hypothetical protein